MPCFSRAVRTADFLVRIGEQNDVARSRNLLPLQGQECHDLSDAGPLHVQGAAPPELRTLDQGGEWVHFPLRAIGRDDIHMVNQQDRFPGRLADCRFEPGIENGLAGNRFVAVHGNALVFEKARQKIGRLRRVTRRI